MTRRGKRKYVPAEAYRYMALLALHHRRGRPATKGELARELRANHYMLTRVLQALVDDGLARVDAARDGAHAVTLTDAGTRYLAEHGASLGQLFADAVATHYRYGRVPAWLPG